MKLKKTKYDKFAKHFNYSNFNEWKEEFYKVNNINEDKLEFNNLEEEANFISEKYGYKNFDEMLLKETNTKLKDKKHNNLLDVLKCVFLILISILLIIIIVDKIIPESKKDKTDTYLSWCKSAYDNPRNPKYYKEELIECVKNWKKIEKKVK